MQTSKAKAGIISFVSCFLLFFIILCFCFPVYNSGDDVFLLYLLDGGFGGGPTNLLHYNYLMHPGLGWVVKTLFTTVPGVNWYSVLLYLFHFISCVMLFRLLLLQHRLYIAAAIFAFVFFVFEAPFLLSPTFTNTALITGMTGILLILRQTAAGSAKKKTIVADVLLILISIMFRLHSLIPLIAISTPLIVFRLLQKRVLLLYFICLTALAIFLLEYFQQHYYESKIPGWKSEESYKSSVFSYYNGLKPESSVKFSTEVYFLNNGLFWDKQFLSAAKIQQIKQETTSDSFMKADMSKNYWYWLFMNNRIFWLSLLVVFLTFSLRLYKPDKIVNILSLVIMLMVFIWLVLFQKLPFYLIPSLILFYILLTTCIPETNPGAAVEYRFINNWVGILFFSGLVCWGGLRIRKASQVNREKNALFTCSWKELNMNPGKLFVVTNDGFPMDYFSVWDRPSRFPISNLLTKDQLMNNTYEPLYKKFSITNAKDFANNPNVVFIGENNNEIRNYFLKTWGVKCVECD